MRAGNWYGVATALLVGLMAGFFFEAWNASDIIHNIQRERNQLQVEKAGLQEEKDSALAEKERLEKANVVERKWAIDAWLSVGHARTAVESVVVAEMQMAKAIQSVRDELKVERESAAP